MTCIDLRPWADRNRYRHRIEEGGDDSAWSVEVECFRGLIYPWGEGDLLAFTDTRGVRAQLLALDPAVLLHQCGDAEAVVRFPSRLLHEVAAILQPKRKGGRPGHAPSVDARSRGLAAIAAARAGDVSLPLETEPGATRATVDDPQAIPTERRAA